MPAYIDPITIEGRCPTCNGIIRARRPPFGETWDTLTRCHHCQDLLWKVATHDSLTFTNRSQWKK